ncbi:hypothetical protein W97_05372 [Coniosporium apollinis CBS 100218]|uniref:F-box domain-containing protein n=1 Tax=Coniosporium apollinis (strain CBS 100218) TaxID=1168221 RepID=R7YWG7_CONA1|nr:uncharacterized protein W97_05372 [Coniosporium apollinis CBS 100218]EON66129.1 hypothetical protein W97_05372 [Coniosporium apollinis CBS 100218]
MLKLPTEIRLRIFEYLLPSRALSYEWPDSDDDSEVYESAACELGDWNMSLLLVNRQIHQEASSTLYGQARFSVDLNSERILIPGARYYVDPVSSDTNPYGQGWKADLTVLPYRKIQRFYVEVTVPYELDTSTPSQWEQALYDVRDNVRRLVALLLEVNRIRELRIVVSLYTCKLRFESVVAPAKWLLEPLWSLRNVVRVDLEDIELLHRSLPFDHESHKYSKTLIGTKSMKGPLDKSEMEPYDTEWSAYVKEKEALFPSTTVAPATPHEVIGAYERITNAAVALRDVVPCGAEWGINRSEHLTQLKDILHLARVARENENLNELGKIGTKLPEIWDGVLRQQEDRRALVDGKVSCLRAEEITNFKITKYFKSISQAND